MRRSSRQIVVILLLVIAAAAIYFYRSRQPEPPEFTPGPISGRLVIHFLDVGQGDAQLIQIPSGETVLIDSGDSGKPTVDLLKRFGVTKLDLVIASHPHQDHIGEMRDILREFDVSEFWDSGFPHPTRTYREMLQEIRGRGITFKQARRGDTRQIGDALLEVLHPGPTFPNDENPNDASVVVRLTYGSRRFLFTGDAEIPEGQGKSSAWRQMLDWQRDLLRADLLKMAHHGSSNGTTAEILDAVRPSIVTISCAAGNDYHHPHPRVMRLLRERDDSISVYRTDLGGTITATTDGSTIEVSSERQVARDLLYRTGDEVAGRENRPASERKGPRRQCEKGRGGKERPQVSGEGLHRPYRGRC
ncbi:MAG TPA: MBL fold metallo-hydrolase, partial [Blastocatellia bacterium]|nr:MBL fold metallo-hydrolase [Blastocatellia bacterium]